MNKEIKEILDRLERIDHKEYIAFEFADSATFDEMARCFDERKKLADCITNLEQENRANKDLIPYFKNKEKDLKKQIKSLQQENERLHIQLEDKANEQIKTMYLEYKSRNEKAIELLKEAGCYDEETKTFCDDVWEELPKLLNILTGGDE